MPIDYKKYPPNWLKEIRPRIMQRANNTCECEGCDFKHLEEVWAVRYRGRTLGWFRDFDEANSKPKTMESKYNTKIKKTLAIPNPKKVKVILTIVYNVANYPMLNIDYVMPSSFRSLIMRSE